MTERIDDKARTDFYDELVAAGHFLPTGMPGIVGGGAAFESVVAGLCAAERALQPAHVEITSLSFPPVVPQAVFIGTDYVTSFPQLIGSVRVFDGDDKAHHALIAEKEARGPWTDRLVDSHLMMVSAACHPIYGTLAGRPLDGDLRFDTIGQCFRHEPSPDPARLVSFRMHEQVLVGSAETTVAHRDFWLQAMLDLFGELGLQVRSVVADDPFFGRAGRLLKAGQREERLKFEIVADIYDDAATAIASGNAHGDHFGVNFGIRQADGSPAHSACFGMGLERTTLALLRTHGMDVASWPAAVQTRLGL